MHALQDYSTRTVHTTAHKRELDYVHRDRVGCGGLWVVGCALWRGRGRHRYSWTGRNPELRTTNEGLGAKYAARSAAHTAFTITADSEADTCPLDLDLASRKTRIWRDTTRRLGFSARNAKSYGEDRDSDSDSHKLRSTSIACPIYVLRGSSAASRGGRAGGQEGGNGKEEEDLQF